MPKTADSDLGKWLLCRLLVKQGYCETDVAKYMKKYEASKREHPNLEEDRTQDMKPSSLKESPLRNF